jgi:hypothetical protein
LEQVSLWSSPVDLPPPIPKEVPRNEVWDTLEEILGFTPRTHTEKTAFGKVVRSFTGAQATPDEMHRAAKEYTKCWPHCELTLWSFEKWFGHFLSKGRKKVVPEHAAPCEECGVGKQHGHAAFCSKAVN